MSLSEWQKNAWLRPHRTDAAEIGRLLLVIERDLTVSADERLDPDWRFVAAFNAALQAATVALYASGFEATKGGGAHHYTIESVKLTVGDEEGLVAALHAFKAKRGGAVYEMVGIATQSELEELRALAVQLRNRVLSWLTHEKPSLLAET